MIDMKKETGKDALYVDTFFARQPIFDAKKENWGYTLLYRHAPDADHAAFDDKDIATLTVISNAIMNPTKPKDGGKGKAKEPARPKQLCINFTEESILKKIPLALPAASTVILVDEHCGEHREVVKAILDLKAEGYKLAIGEFTGSPAGQGLLEHADLVFVDVLDRDPVRLKELLAMARSCNAVCGAKRVEDLEQFELCQQLGFSLFQGYFFEKPVIVPGRKLSSNQISRLMLFKVLEKENPDFDEIAKVIQTDVSISYRLLALINSANFALSRKVDSIRQALVLLGMKQIKSWLWLIFLTDISPKDKTSELPYLSAIRAKFMERTAVNHDIPQVKSDALYLLGLFSLLEALLDIPFKDLARNLPLDDGIVAALVGKRNEYTPWLEMARFFERGEWDKIDEVITELKLDPMTVANSYAEALTWAKGIQGEAI